MIIALAGRRIDADDAETSYFPPRNVDRVRHDLRQLFVTLRPQAVVCSAASGADLLALDEAGALGIRRHVVLGSDPVRFAESSVLDRPGDWRSIYERVIAGVDANQDLVIVGSRDGGQESYLLSNQVILNEAVSLSKSSDGKVTVVLVWNGESRGPDDVTDAFRAEAEKRGFPVFEIRTD
jgi:hypothetical protein